jgi:hypothetical protein
MSLFDKISKRLFPSDKKIDVQEILSRTPKFLEYYTNWMNTQEFYILKQDLLESWSNKRNHMQTIVDMAVYRSDYANGFTVYPSYKNGLIPLSFLMEYLKDQTVKTSYRLVHADRRMKEKRTHIETLEKYYLKPPLSTQIPIDQMYGNIMIELLKHDEEEIRLKVLVNVYSDRNYTQAGNFHDLMSFLFEN